MSSVCLSPPYFSTDLYSAQVDISTLLTRRAEFSPRILREFWELFWVSYEEFQDSLPKGFFESGTIQKDFSKAVVSIGGRALLSDEQFQKLESVVRNLIPWRKGPYSLFGLEIDSEWNSDYKWNRIAPHLQGIRGKCVADVGCSNGYYMFRASELNPKCIVGFEPAERPFLCFQFLQSLFRVPNTWVEPVGIEDAPLFKEFFDVILCFGVLYHQRSPLERLVDLKSALNAGGELIIESQVIEGAEPVALFPNERYAKARNVYFIPTVSALQAWMLRAGFVDVELLSVEATTLEEQRSTSFAPGESLPDFLSPDDPRKTIEGYPAPLRAMVRGRKK